MNVRYRVTLSAEERAQFQCLVSGGKGRVRRIKRAQILLAADARAADDVVAANVSVGASTIYRTKRCLVEEGLEQALSEEPRPRAQAPKALLDHLQGHFRDTPVEVTLGPGPRSHPGR